MSNHSFKNWANWFGFTMSKRWAPSFFNKRVSSTYLSYFCCCDSSCGLGDWPILRPNRVPLLRNSWAKYPAMSTLVETGSEPASLGNLVTVGEDMGFWELWPWCLSLRLPPPFSGSGARREGGRIVLVLIFSSTLHTSLSSDRKKKKWERNLSVEWRKCELKNRVAMITRKR